MLARIHPITPLLREPALRAGGAVRLGAIDADGAPVDATLGVDADSAASAALGDAAADRVLRRGGVVLLARYEGGGQSSRVWLAGAAGAATLPFRVADAVVSAADRPAIFVFGRRGGALLRPGPDRLAVREIPLSGIQDAAWWPSRQLLVLTSDEIVVVAPTGEVAHRLILEHEHGAGRRVSWIDDARFAVSTELPLDLARASAAAEPWNQVVSESRRPPAAAAPAPIEEDLGGDADGIIELKIGGGPAGGLLGGLMDITSAPPAPPAAQAVASVPERCRLVLGSVADGNLSSEPVPEPRIQRPDQLAVVGGRWIMVADRSLSESAPVAIFDAAERQWAPSATAGHRVVALAADPTGSGAIAILGKCDAPAMSIASFQTMELTATAIAAPAAPQPAPGGPSDAGPSLSSIMDAITSLSAMVDGRLSAIEGRLGRLEAQLGESKI